MGKPMRELGSTLDDAAGVDGVRAVGSSARVPVVVAPAGDGAGATPEDVYALNESSGGAQPAGLSFDGDLALFVAGGRGEDDEYLDATVAGSLDLAAPDSGVIVSDAMADEQGLELGDDMTVVGPFREMNVPVTTAKGCTKAYSLMQVDAKNVIIDTVKLAEDGSGDMIVRLYESKHADTDVRLTFGFEAKQVHICDMLENPQQKLTVSGSGVEFGMRAFEVKTLRIKRK